MKKYTLSLLLLVSLLAFTSVAQAYVFQLYDNTGTSPTTTVSELVSFTSAIGSGGSSVQMSYFSIIPNYPGSSSTPVTFDVAYSGSGSPWNTYFEIAPKSNLNDVQLLGGGFGFGTASGVESQNLTLMLKTIYGFTLLAEADGAGAYAQIAAKLSLPAEKPANTPIPAAVWLLGTGLVGLVGVRRKIAA